MADYEILVDRHGSGWCSVQTTTIPGTLLVQYSEPDDTGRVRLQAVLYDCTPRFEMGAIAPVTGANLRRWNLARIEAALNGADALPERRGEQEVEADLDAAEPGRSWPPRLDLALNVYKLGLIPPARRAMSASRLTSLPGSRVTDGYLQSVAAAYRAAVAKGDRRPAATLAADCGASPRTVQGWIARCRDRGYLPPGRRGAAG